MGTLAVVVAQPGSERTCAPPRARVGASVRPAANERLDEAFCFAVGLRPVRTRAGKSHAATIGGPPKSPTDVAAAVVRQHTGDGNPAPSKPAHRAAEEAGGRRARLIGQYLDIGRATVIINGDMHVFPPRAHAAALLGMDPMARAQNASERLHVEMHELARPGSLIPL